MNPDVMEYIYAVWQVVPDLDTTSMVTLLASGLALSIAGLVYMYRENRKQVSAHMEDLKFYHAQSTEMLIAINAMTKEQQEMKPVRQTMIDVTNRAAEQLRRLNP